MSVDFLCHEKCTIRPRWQFFIMREVIVEVGDNLATMIDFSHQGGERRSSVSGKLHLLRRSAEE